MEESGSSTLLCMPAHSRFRRPPEDFHTTEYKLTVDGYKRIVISFIAALALDKPIVMGCSMAGSIVCHLALENPSHYRAMIALEGVDNLSPYYDLDRLHRPDVHGGEI